MINLLVGLALLSIGLIALAVLAIAYCLSQWDERYARRRRGHTPFYETYLRSEAWRIKRFQKLQEVGFRCEHSGFHAGHLQIHHKHYDNLGSEHLSDLTVLCRRHHQLVHGRGF